MSSRKQTKLILIALITIITLNIITSVRSETVNVPGMKIELTPFQSQLSGYSITDKESLTVVADNIQLVQGSEISSGVWYSPSPKYPDLEVVSSNPFLVDNSGQDAMTPEQYKVHLADPDNVASYGFVDGKNFQIRIVNLAIDVAIRSRSNPPQINYQNYFESPLNQLPFSFLGGTRNSLFSVYTDESSSNPSTILRNPIGVLLATRDVGAANWPLAWELGSSLETQAKIGFSLEDYHNPNFETNLRSNYGNSKIVVEPTFIFTAIENFMKFDYYKVINGELFHLTPGDTQMVLLDAIPITSYNKVGKVPNYSPKAGFTINMDQSDAAMQEYKANDPSISEVDAKYSTISQRYASFKYQFNELASDITGEITNPLSISKNVSFPSSIDPDLFDTLPKSAKVSYSTVMQPYTSVNYATYKVQYCGYAYSGLPWNSMEKYWEGEYDIKFPYNLKAENVYSIYRVMFPVLMKSSQTIDYIPASGTPVRVEDIYDYNINDVGVLNPNSADLSGSTLEIHKDPLAGIKAWWDDNQAGIITIIIALVVGLIAVAVVIVVIKKKN